MINTLKEDEQMDFIFLGFETLEGIPIPKISSDKSPRKEISEQHRGNQSNDQTPSYIKIAAREELQRSRMNPLIKPPAT